MIEIYKNLFIDHHCFFVKLGSRPKPCKSEPSASIGFIVEQRDGKWTCGAGSYYDDTIKHDMVLIAKSEEIIKQSIISAVLNAYKESSGYDLGSESKEGTCNE